MTHYYQGKFKPKNPSKCIGDPNNIVYRSSWELAALKWLDQSDSIVKYSSEEVIVPYFFDVDKKMHRYFVDLLFVTQEGKTYLIEIKPDKQTRAPSGARKTKQYVSEAITYVQNQCKWRAAEKYAEDRGWHFEVWTEHTLQNLGIMPKPLKPLKRMKSPKVPKK